MATVYRAEDLKHGRRVAIKVLRPELTALGYQPERFLREIRIAARLTHPQILPLHDSGESDGVLYYVMPYIGRESLRGRLQRERQLPVEVAVRFARSIAGALDYAHRQDVLHRDIKPENILLVEGEPVIADFGVARAISAAGADTDTAPGLAVGTPAYMSPEQASADHELDGRSDVYSLACVLYEMLAGRPPFTGPNPRAVMARQAVASPAPLRAQRPEVSEHTERVILRALAKEPADRFSTAAAFAEALGAHDSGIEPSGAGGELRNRRAVAVLPFVNASPDPENEYFSDGMADELINALANVEGLRVASRTSAFAYKGVRQDIRAIAAALNVSAAIEGTVRRAGSRLRITAQLTNASDGRLLWSERYDREAEDVFALQDEIAQTIVRALRPLLGDLGDPTPRRYTHNVKAYNLYLKGRFCWNLRTPEGVGEAIRFFEQAIAEDPDYALAYTGLADSYGLQLDYRGAPVQEGMQRAKAEAQKALALDDALAEAHTSLGWVTFIYDWDWPAAEREFRRAIELNPRYSTARQWYAWWLVAMGRMDEALAESRAAAELDPASVSIRRSMGWVHYYARQYDAAIAQLLRALAMNPTAEESHRVLGLAYTQKGMLPEAEAALREAIASSAETTPAIAALGRVMALAGRRTEAQEQLALLVARGRERYVSPAVLVPLLIALDQTDEVFAKLEEAYRDRRGYLAYLKVEPVLDPLRGDPRFAAMIERMRLG